jgi:hypothetical protein
MYRTAAYEQAASGHTAWHLAHYNKLICSALILFTRGPNFTLADIASAQRA